MITRRTALLSASAFALAPTPLRAAEPDTVRFPSKRITLVVPFGAGGSNDILARAIGQAQHWAGT